LKQQVGAVATQVKNLQAEVEKLQERLHKTLHNSFKPASSDHPNVPPQAKRVKGQHPPGKQAGHPGAGRKLKPLHQASKPVAVKGLLDPLLGRKSTNSGQEEATAYTRQTRDPWQLDL
jgi:hypothetical protein